MAAAGLAVDLVLVPVALHADGQPLLGDCVGDLALDHELEVSHCKCRGAVMD